MTRSNRLLLAGLLVAALAPAGQAHARDQIPGAIAVPEGNKLSLKAHAEGVQIYACNATATGPAWGLVAPRANLYDKRGRVIGTHFAGPTWQADDGSKVVGKRDAGVNVDPSAIDWLLLSAVSSASGPRKHDDLLAGTTYIQRINTTAGLVPATADCHAGTVGNRVEVPYAADYLFYKARRRCKD
jgi:Protein of unknown function (DUF3455)